MDRPPLEGVAGGMLSEVDSDSGVDEVAVELPWRSG